MASELRVNYIKNRSGLGTVTFADEGLIIAGITSINLGNSNLIVGSGTSTGTENQVLQANGGAYVSDNLGVGLTNPTSKLDVSGDAKVTGVVTATTFVGALTGTATTATALQNSRTFEITGDIVASPISFNGTGNVSLAATIQPNSVALGTDTTGDYVTNITGTSNQITVTSGTGEGSTPTLSVPNQFTAPQDVTVTRDLQVNRNLNVNGNITIGGTSAFIAASELKIYDPDIVLGVRTDGSGNDISTDNTANHGGIAIASTEGSPLVSLYDVGVGETNPATYKKFMWFKSGTFSGLGTDAWLSNYAVGIGSTQFPTGTRLAAGNIQLSANDINVVRNINSSGVVTATSATFNGGNLLVGSTSATGTASQPLQVTGGAYVSGNLGLGVTNPSQKLHIVGSVYLDSSAAERQIIFNNGTTNVYYYGQTVGNGGNLGMYDGTNGRNVWYYSPSGASFNILLNTNVTGSITASSQLISTVATGTAPLSVTSTTVVTNLNADLLDGLNSSSFVRTDASSTISPSNTLSFGSGTRQMINLWSTGYGLGVQSSTLYCRSDSRFSWHRGGSHSDSENNAGGGTVAMTLDGSSNLTVTGNVSGYSDIRLKDNIQTIPNALDKVSKLRGVEFDRNDMEEKPHQIGVIAQEVEEIIPEVVNTDNMGIKSVAYGNLVGLLIEAIKDLKEEVNELKVKLEEK